MGWGQRGDSLAKGVLLLYYLCYYVYVQILKEKLQKLLLFIDSIKYRRDRHFYWAVLAFMAVLLTIFAGLYLKVRSDVQVRDNVLESYYEDQPREQSGKLVKVYICGEVVRPGVYALDPESRISDALELAGGPGPEAVLESLNLARRVVDEEKILVPGEKDLEQTDQSGLVNINTASQQVLETLPGIGPATAQNIIQYRDSEGSFTSIQDIQKVWGIGEKKFSEIKDLISV